MIYDVIVIGAGSAGVHTAHFLRSGGAKVAIVERFDIAAGGSGAAGAFITPRLGKGGPIQRWSNEAFRFSVALYEKSPYFYKTALLRLPKEGECYDGLERYLEGISFERKEDGFLFFDAGVLKAKEHLHSLAQNIDFYRFEGEVRKRGELFIVGELKAKNVVLATGAWDEELRVPYIRIGKVSGVRFDLKTSLRLSFSLHKKISISKNIEGKVVVGATHHRLEEKNPPKSPTWLLQEAKRMVGDFSYSVERMVCGIRSSVNDHLPIIGELVDMQRVKPVKNIKKLDLSSLPRSGVYVINALGGRGFVFGPYMGYLLSERILRNAPIDKEIDVDRYFLRYLKKGRV